MIFLQTDISIKHKNRLNGHLLDDCTQLFRLSTGSSQSKTDSRIQWNMNSAPMLEVARAPAKMRPQMKPAHRFRAIGLSITLRCFAILCAVCPAMGATSPSAAEVTAIMNAFELSSGVMVDPTSGVVYAMNPQHGIDAIELSSGKMRWSSNASAKPLAMAGEKLLAQGDASGDGAALPIMIIDAKSGALLKKLELPLPAGVMASVDRMMESSFEDGARLEQDVALVWWTFSYRKVSGIARPEGNAARTESGGARIDLQSGHLTSLSAQEVAAERAAASPSPKHRELTPEPDYHVAFPSSDGHFFLAWKSMGADSSGMQTYRWRIYSLDTRKIVAEVTMPTSAAPFTVWNSLLIYVSSPSARRVGGVMIQEPLQLRAIDIKSGAERWKRPMRDIAFRGIVPPRP
jgi:hypothetical protein